MENGLELDEGAEGFGGSALTTGAGLGLGAVAVVVEAIVFLIAPMVAAPAAEALLLRFFVLILAKGLVTPGFVAGDVTGVQLWSVGNR